MNFTNRFYSLAFVNWRGANSFLLVTILSSTCFGQGLSTLPESGQPGSQPLQNLITESNNIAAQIRYSFGLSLEGIHLKDGSFNMMNRDIRDDPDLTPKDKAALSGQNKDLSGDDTDDASPPDEPPGDGDNDDGTPDGTNPPLPGSPPAGNGNNNGPAPPSSGNGGGTVVSNTPDPGSGLLFIAPAPTMKDLLGGYADPDFDFPADLPDEISADLYRHYDVVQRHIAEGIVEIYMFSGSGLTHSINEINRLRRGIDRHQLQKQLETWREQDRLEFEKREAEFERYWKSQLVLATIRAGEEKAGTPEDWIDIIQRSNFTDDWKVRIIDAINNGSGPLRGAIKTAIKIRKNELRQVLRDRKIAELEGIPYEEVPLINFSARIFLYNNNNTHAAWIMEDPKSPTGWRIYESWTKGNVANSQLVSQFAPYKLNAIRRHAMDGLLTPLQSTPEKHRKMLSLAEKRNDLITNSPTLFRYSLLSAGGLTHNCASDGRGLAVESGHSLPEGSTATAPFMGEKRNSDELSNRVLYGGAGLLGQIFGGDSPARLESAVRLYSKGLVSINATGKERLITTWIPMRNLWTHFYWPWGEGTDLELQSAQTVFGPQDFEVKLPQVGDLSPPPAVLPYGDEMVTDSYPDNDLITRVREPDIQEKLRTGSPALYITPDDQLVKIVSVDHQPPIEELGIQFPEEWDSWLDQAKDRMETGVHVEPEIRDMIAERDERQRQTTFQTGDNSKANCPIDPPGKKQNQDPKVIRERISDTSESPLKNVIGDHNSECEFDLRKTNENKFIPEAVEKGKGTIKKESAKVAALPNERFFNNRNNSIQSDQNQSALKQIGLTVNTLEELNTTDNKQKTKPVIVAVIDTGVDVSHPELWGQLWRNQGEIPFNNIDDDRNGYVDDVYGWNTQANNENIVDDNGHGTHVAGIISARWDGRGIAGIAPHAKLMTLKAADAKGQTDAVRISLAIRYAVTNGAKIIHMSIENSQPTELEQAMVDWANKQGVLVIAASGSKGLNTAQVSPANLKGVLTVGACDQQDKRSRFSGWGQHVDLVAPGADILSLRARGTDFMHTMAGEARGIKANERVIDQRWYRAEGTSFAAPLVTGVAAALWAKNPELTVQQIKNKLITSCDDIEQRGWDTLTGAGRLNAAKALKADPNHYLGTKIFKISARNQNGQRTLVVPGEASGTQFQRRWLQLAYGKNPPNSDWKSITVSETPVNNGILGEILGTLLDRRGTWTIRSVVQDSRGAVRQAQVTIQIK